MQRLTHAGAGGGRDEMATWVFVGMGLGEAIIRNIHDKTLLRIF
jgi:hypothetical protein